MKDISALNTESVVFVVEHDEVRWLLGMLLAAVGLDARTYSNCDEFMARHDSCRAQYLVLDMQFPGMEGLIIRQQRTSKTDLSETKTSDFQLIPVKNRRSCESFLFRPHSSNAVI
jgi:FixJ family two-component response regulator